METQLKVGDPCLYSIYGGLQKGIISAVLNNETPLRFLIDGWKIPETRVFSIADGKNKMKETIRSLPNIRPRRHKGFKKGDYVFLKHQFDFGLFCPVRIKEHDSKQELCIIQFKAGRGIYGDDELIPLEKAIPTFLNWKK